jgi:hypothetical protein
MARFFAARRAAGDPYDETLVLPAVIVILALRLNDLKRLDDLAAIAIFMVTSLGAGVWLGASLGMSGTLRVMLRSVSVGALEAAGYSALNDTVDRSHALSLAGQMVYIKFFFFWAGHITTSMLRDFMLISEADWQRGVPNRAWIYKVYRVTLGGEELKGSSDDILVTVWAVRLLGPPLLMAWVAALFGVSPLAWIRAYLHL